MVHPDDTSKSGATEGSGPDTDTVSRDWIDAGSPSYAVVQTVAEAIGSHPDELRPLNDVVDTDGLDALFGRDTTVGGDRDLRVRFRFEGCRVVVTSDGRAAATPVDKPSPSSP